MLVDLHMLCLSTMSLSIKIKCQSSICQSTSYTFMELACGFVCLSVSVSVSPVSLSSQNKMSIDRSVNQLNPFMLVDLRVCHQCQMLSVKMSIHLICLSHCQSLSQFNQLSFYFLRLWNLRICH